MLLRFVGLVIIAFFICNYVVSKPDKNVVNKESYSHPVMVDRRDQLIPRIIVQTNEKDYIPKLMKDTMDKLIQDNPEYVYIYFNNENAERFIKNNMPLNVLKSYQKLVPGAYKADLFRYCFLWVHGGVYIDSAMHALQPMRNIIHSKDVFICPEDNGTGKLYNAFMCSIPKHPIVGKAIDIVVHNVENELYLTNSLDITGPGALAKAFKSYTNQKHILSGKYMNNIQILNHDGPTGTISGDIGIIFNVKYDGYIVDRIWYNTNPHYSDLWNTRQVYLSPQKDLKIKNNNISKKSLEKNSQKDSKTI